MPNVVRLGWAIINCLLPKRIVGLRPLISLGISEGRSMGFSAQPSTARNWICWGSDELPSGPSSRIHPRLALGATVPLGGGSPPKRERICPLVNIPG